MELGLRGKAAIVTGGSRGIGKAVARTLLSEGCAVTICARNGERLEGQCGTLPKLARASWESRPT
jgi:3-oxoacyl-[acyl-carrier protein] reductase